MEWGFLTHSIDLFSTQMAGFFILLPLWRAQRTDNEGWPINRINIINSMAMNFIVNQFLKVKSLLPV